MLLLIAVGYAVTSGEFGRAVSFLFQPDFSKLTTSGILVALGHAFFTLSLGMGAIMVYGSYMPRSASITSTTVIIALMDTVVALVAGMAIFPIVFANGLAPSAGPGLVFVSLPIAFGEMPGGALFGTLFFVLLSFAAWTSAISLIEPAVAWLVENRGHSRIYAATVAGIITWLMGLLTVFSFNIGEDIKLLSFIDKFADSTMFDLLDYLFGPIKSATGNSTNQLKLYDAEDIITASYLFSSNIIGSGTWCFTVSENEKREGTEIIGANGKIVFSFFEHNPIEITGNRILETVSIDYPQHVKQA